MKLESTHSPNGIQTKCNATPRIKGAPAVTSSSPYRVAVVCREAIASMVLSTFGMFGEGARYLRQLPQIQHQANH
jgi:hypothetical protein